MPGKICKLLLWTHSNASKVISQRTLIKASLSNQRAFCALCSDSQTVKGKPFVREQSDKLRFIYLKIDVSYIL